MKYLFFSLILSLLVGASVCCAPARPPKTTEQQEKEFVEALQNKTVALVKDFEKEMYPYCSGVWVARDLILTAHHCLKGEAVTIRYKTIKDKDLNARIAFPIKYDEFNDLLLLKALEGTLPRHPVAKIANSEWIGERVHIVGHPNGMWWSYFQGEISARRKSYDDKEEKYQKLFQISAPVWKGNSGGGAFDSNGNLLGISSWIMLDAPLMAFFIHREAIIEFLEGSENL